MKLGHGAEENELVPRLIEGVLVGKGVVGVTAGGCGGVPQRMAMPCHGTASPCGTATCCSMPVVSDMERNRYNRPSFQ